jgi:hypothetical protein
MATLGHYSQYRNVWVEITKAEHQHGGEGWEFGKCLWSPTTNRAHHRRYRLMEQLWPADLVLHFLHGTWPGAKPETRLCGASLVADRASIVDTEPPTPGVWAGLAPYYRVDLKAYTPFPQPVSMDVLEHAYGEEIRREIVDVRPRYYPFNTYGQSIRTVQGIYLASCTPHLYLLLKDALGIEEAAAEVSETEPNRHEEYTEGIRAARERYFFTRNATLARRAKELFGYVCQACDFQFNEAYGELGDGFIECHHLNPLSERSEEEWTEGIRTRLDDVTTLCSNCHRMIHRRRPAVTLGELRAIVSSKGQSQTA